MIMIIIHAGRKKLRRLVFQLYRTASVIYTNLPFNDNLEEYEALFSKEVNNCKIRIKWLAQHTLIDIENKFYRSTTRHEEHPRDVTLANTIA